MKLIKDFGNLIEGELIVRKSKKTKLAYKEISIKLSDEQLYKNDGWNHISKRYKNSLRIRKNKAHLELFVDKIWTLFANLGFNYMNEDKFFIEYNKNNQQYLKEIDVFAIDEQLVLIIECKSYDQLHEHNFQNEINRINSDRKEIINEIKNHFEGEPTIAWILCTNNVKLKENDLDELKNNNILYLNHDDIKYYEELVKRIGEATKYQMFGRFFSNKDIPELRNKVPAIKGKMGGFTYYSFSIEPDTLLQISYILHRTNTTDETLNTYQRMVNKKRITQINDFINGDMEKGIKGGFFPNSIIINIDSIKNKGLQFDLANSSLHHSNSVLGVLHLPKRYRSAYVIDGQHRLYGYANTKYKKTNTIPVVAFEDLPADVQSNLFVDINNKQKSVNKNLLKTLDGELRWNSSNPDDAIRALKSKLSQLLSERADSPLYGRIITGEDVKSHLKCITLTYFSDYGLNKTKFFGEVRNRKLVVKGFLDNGDLADKTLIKSYDFFKKCFDLIVTFLPEQWEKGDLEGGFIAKNIGVASYVVIINDILEHEKNVNNIEYSDLSSQGIFKLIEPYLISLLGYLNSINKDDLINMSKQYGAGGVDKVRREFQKHLHDKYNDFNPKGLEQYILDSSGIFNKETRENIIDIQERVRDYIFNTLKAEYGEEEWWTLGVPIKIQQSCSIKAIEDRKKEKDWNYLLLLDYQDIIRTKWNLLGNTFTSPEDKQSSKEKKLEWFVGLNKIRNKVMHPEREKIKEEEYKFVNWLKDWLLERLIVRLD